MGHVFLGHSAPKSHSDRASEGQPTGCHVGPSNIKLLLCHRTLLVHTVSVLLVKILQILLKL